MWTTIALSSALLLPAQSGGLDITHQRIVSGMFGPERKDSRLLPGEILWVRFDVENLRVNQAGQMRYSMEMEIRDSKNKLIFRQEPRDLTWVNTLGGDRLPAMAQAFAGFDQAAGEYTLAVTVADRDKGAKNSKKTLKQKFEITEKTFGLVQPFISNDLAGQVPVPWLGVPGQTLFVNFMATGFKTESRPGGQEAVDADLHVEMRILDENGKPTLDKPITGDLKELPKPLPLVPMQFRVDLSRAGKFTIEITAKDKKSNKTSQTLKLPITVLDMER
jgi:hypothetical protein